MYEKAIAKLKTRLQKSEELTQTLQDQIIKLEIKQITTTLKKQQKTYLIIKHSIDAMNDSIEYTSDVEILNEI